jgi:hypothetical protein
MTVKPVNKKMGIKDGMRAIFINAPTEAMEAIELPNLQIESELTGTFDYIHLFSKNQEALKKHFPEIKTHLKPSGMLWVSWPKNGQLETDLSLPKIINIVYGFGLVESTALSIDDTWSALKFTHPKKGKVYNNSHGKLIV